VPADTGMAGVGIALAGWGRELGCQERQMNLLCQCQYVLGFGEERLAIAK